MLLGTFVKFLQFLVPVGDNHESVSDRKHGVRGPCSRQDGEGKAASDPEYSLYTQTSHVSIWKKY